MIWCAWTGETPWHLKCRCNFPCSEKYYSESYVVFLWIIAQSWFMKITTWISEAIDPIWEVNCWPKVIILKTFWCQVIVFCPFCCIICFHIPPLDVLSPLNKFAKKRWNGQNSKCWIKSWLLNIVQFQYFCPWWASIMSQNNGKYNSNPKF